MVHVLHIILDPKKKEVEIEWKDANEFRDEDLKLIKNDGWHVKECALFYDKHVGVEERDGKLIVHLSLRRLEESLFEGWSWAGHGWLDDC